MSIRGLGDAKNGIADEAGEFAASVMRRTASLKR
jgi:hypothetical protein